MKTNFNYFLIYKFFKKLTDEDGKVLKIKEIKQTINSQKNAASFEWLVLILICI